MFLSRVRPTNQNELGSASVTNFIPLLHEITSNQAASDGTNFPGKPLHDRQDTCRNTGMHESRIRAKGMNLSLVDPFVLAQDYPESLTGKLSKDHERKDL